MLLKAIYLQVNAFLMEFRYTATNNDGMIKGDTVIADSKQDLLMELQRAGLTVITIDELPEPQISFIDNLFNKVSNDDKVQFLDYFASMLEAGLSVNEVLQAFYEDLDKPMLRKFIKDTQEKIRNGKKLSECFADYSEIFPQLYVGMVEVGEASGTLAQSLRQLATQLKKTNEIRSKVKNAMIYPMIIVTALTVVVTALIVVVFPRLRDFFADSKVPLPATTQFFLSISDGFRSYWYIVIILIVVIYIGLKQANKTVGFQRFKADLFLRVPIFGKINKNTNVALFARTLGSLMESGVNILPSLDVVKGSISNYKYIEIVDVMKEDLAKGNSLSDSMKKFPKYFGPFEIRVASISERTGELSKGLLNVAEYYEAKLFSLLAGLSSALEPVLLLGMGGIVVIVALSVITPIYQLMAGINTIGT